MTLQVHALRLCVRAARVKFRLNFLKFLVHRPSIPRLPAQGLAQVADSKGGRRPSLPVLASEMFLSKSPFPEQNAHYLHFAINDNWADKLYFPPPHPFQKFLDPPLFSSVRPTAAIYYKYIGSANGSRAWACGYAGRLLYSVWQLEGIVTEQTVGSWH